MEYSIRLTQPGDEHQIVELLNQEYDGWPQFDLACPPLEHWKWRYQSHPVKNNLVSVGVGEGSIIGCVHAIPRDLKIYGRIVASCLAPDLAVKPGYRKHGVSIDLVKSNSKLLRKTGIEAAYFETRNPVLVKSNFRRYPRIPIEVLHYINVKNISLHYQHSSYNYPLLKKSGSWILKMLNAFGALPPAVKLKSDRSPIRWINRFERHYQFIAVRDQRLLNWRFCDPRGGDYQIACLDDGSHIEGYIVLRINRRIKSYPVGYILDLLTLPESNGSADILIAFGRQYFKRKRVNIIHTLVPRAHPYQNALKRNGFFYSRQKVNLYYLPLAEIKEDIAALMKSPPEKIYFSYGDIDTI